MAELYSLGAFPVRSTTSRPTKPSRSVALRARTIQNTRSRRARRHATRLRRTRWERERGPARNVHDDLGYLGRIPVPSLVFIVVGVPLVAAAAGWLLAGRQPPAIARPAIE